MMDPPKAKLSLFEIAMIEQMNLDPGYEQYHEYVDMKVDFKFREHYEDHPKKYLPRLLAERAKLYCCKKMEIPVNDHQANWQRWIVVLPVFTLASFLFFAIVTALGVPTMFFSGEKQEANVLTVSVLICVMTLLSLIPTISLISLIFQKLKKRDSATIAVVTLWLIENRGGWALLRRQPRSSQRETSSPFATLLKKQSYFVSASTIFLSNLYFVLMGIAIWGVLWVFLFSEDVDYVLKGSLDSGEGGVTFIESVGKPVTYITGTPAPGPRAMRWADDKFAFDETLFVSYKDGKMQAWSEEQIEEHKNKQYAVFRSDWSYFLLSSVWTWVFLPRVLVAVVACACIVWFRRDLLPKVDDSNNRKIVNHIMNRANEVDEIDQPEVVDVLDVVEVVDVVDVVDVVESEPRIERFAVVGFGLGSGVSNSTKRLVNLDTRLKDCGNLNGAKPQLRFRSQWQGKEFAGTSLVLLASLTSVPTVSFGEFLSDLVASAKGRAPGAQPAIQVILTDGKETRERLEYDQDKFETRVNQWIGRIVESGVDKESVLTFDVSTDTGVSSAWNELKPDSAAFEFEGLQFAGETKQAIKIVRRQFADALSAGTRSSDDDWLKHLTLISNELGKLYEKERLSFLKYLDGKKCADTVKAAIDSAELPSGMLPEEFQAMAKAMALFKTLSPKWIGAGALGGLALGVASGIAIIATGGALALPILIPTVITPTFGGAVTAQFLKTHWFSKLPQDKSLETRPATADALSDAAIHALKASILQIIVLELQGNPEGKITQQLREQTQRLDHHPLRNMNDIETMLDDFQMGMSKIGGQS